jgi:hypothetical protein
MTSRRLEKKGDEGGKDQAERERGKHFVMMGGLYRYTSCRPRAGGQMHAQSEV